MKKQEHEELYLIYVHFEMNGISPTKGAIREMLRFGLHGKNWLETEAEIIRLT